VLRPRRPWLTALGVAIAAAVVAPPAHRLADDLLVAHMGQHLVLAVVTPLLIALGAPPVPPARAGPMAAATAAHLGSLAFWHVPLFYDAAVRSTPLHLLEHCTLLGAGLLFWPLVLSAPSGLAALFTAGLGSGALAALLTLSPHPLYRAHLATAPLHGLPALGDQQLAGALMWVPGGIAYSAVAIALLLRWLGREPKPLRLPPGAVSGTLVVLAALTVARMVAGASGRVH
jgi:putative membrane protein